MLSANKLHGTELFPSLSASDETCRTHLELHGTVTAMTPINSCGISLRSETKYVSDRSLERKTNYEVRCEKISPCLYCPLLLEDTLNGRKQILVLMPYMSIVLVF